MGSIDKPKTFKAIVKDITSNDHLAYSSFWTEDHCWRLFVELERLGEVIWSGTKKPINLQDCTFLFKEYLINLSEKIGSDGITPSWFHVFSKLHGQHTVILNSFGVDT